jgi:hypothetical protein
MTSGENLLTECRSAPVAPLLAGLPSPQEATGGADAATIVGMVD